MAEKRLLLAARRGDRKAVGELLRRAAAPAWRWSMGFCRNDDDAADLAQDVLVTLLRSLSRFRGDASLSTWTYVVARRACARRKRRAGRQTSLDAPGHASLIDRVDPSPGPAAHLERRRLAAKLEQEIAALPAAQREVLVMRDVEGLSARKVGVVLGVGERAVKSRLHRARMVLRERLGPFVTGHAAAAPSPGCPESALLLSRQLEGELSAADCARMERHARDCRGCRDRCAELQRVLGACRTYGVQPVPRELRDAMRDALEGLEGRPPGAASR